MVITLCGFVLGFAVGLGVNGYLLRHIPKERYKQDKSLQLKYGLLNWSFALAGAFLAYFVTQ